jgi:hypothetical protein
MHRNRLTLGTVLIAAGILVCGGVWGPLAVAQPARVP